MCVRIQSMNGININLFQFERDLTWMAFFLDGNDRVYARYGGRDQFNAEVCVSKESLVRVMRQVLERHQAGAVQAAGRFESGAQPVRTPEQIPPMTRMMARREENKCIHCHDVKAAELRHLQSLGQFRREQVFTYPMPSAVGLEMAAAEQNRVERVRADSPASRAGVQAGDVLMSADGYHILTQADLARVLELTPKVAKLPLTLSRGDETLTAELALSGDWRRGVDPSWRETLHLAGPGGGFWGQKLSADDRQKQGVAIDAMAVRVTYIWGDHTRRAGVKVGDVVVEFDGLKRDMRINELHAHLHLNRNYGDQISLSVLRDGKRESLSMKLPAEASSD